MLAACADRTPARSADLPTYLAAVASEGQEARTREVASWRLDEAAWRRIVVDPYRALHADYLRAFDAAAPALVANLVAPVPTISARPHFAGDPQLTTGQVRARWALPVAFASEIAMIGGAPIDAVFVRDGDRWRAIVGLDVVIRARVDRLDPACGALLDIPAPPPRCRDVAWEVADAALRSDRDRFRHACTLATTLCGKPSR